ncbi:MAG TPA: septum formation initiator [Clostridiales bacterium]|nr:DivIVA domain-containing protein [Clostridia bacterium]HCS75822.1 septum formation initiator [Clostridiales bacterium]
MALTPIDIHNKEFERSFRGYNEDEVDQFLDNIVDEFEKLYKENLEMKDRITHLMDQINQFRTMEKTLKDTLVTAQKTADEVTAVAQQKAKLILQEAEEQARQIRVNASQDVVEANREQFAIRKQIRILKAKIRSLLESQIEEIEQLADDDIASTDINSTDDASNNDD